jgi:hypothetical protein
MKFNLICDESSTAGKHLVIGAITVPRRNHVPLVNDLNRFKRSLGFRTEGEIKWGKVSRFYSERYEKISSWFFEQIRATSLTFRAHVINVASPDYRKYGSGNLERAFYKAYFHVLFRSVVRLALEEDGSNILVLMDDKRNRYRFQLSRMKRSLNSNLERHLKVRNLVANVEPRPSSGPKAEPFIQIVDLLIGAIAYRRNFLAMAGNCCPAKVEMVSKLEALAGAGFHLDTIARAPFNIFTFDVAHAMERKKQFQEKAKAARAPKLLPEPP